MSRRARRRWVLLCAQVVALSLASPVAAQVASAKDGPRICLVLSGGGARGAAHIGVLKVLEELRVPIHCIAGTSMGAIVGGAYASGMTTAEMERHIGLINTDLIVKELPPRADQQIRRKLDDRTILFGLELGIGDDGVLFPKGVVSGIQLETVLRQLSKLSGYHRFDELPIPYRAVATDLVSGKAVVFDQGELANVMRASMSVPGAIAPAEVEGQLLVDGGLTNNLPVDVARRMGADVVVAVNLGTTLAKREQLTSVLGITGQMINILTEQNVQASLASLRPTDILIEPLLGDFAATDFDNMRKTVPIGEDAARVQTARLAALGVRPERYASLRARQTKGSPPDLAPVDEIRFKPMTRVNPDSARESLATRVGEPLSSATLDSDMRRLYGTGDFEHVNFHLFEDAGKRVLEIDAVEKSWGPNYLRFGLALGYDFEGDAFFNVAVSHRRTWINSLGAEWRTDAQIGRTSLLRTEFYQPLAVDRTLFVVPTAEIARRTFDLYDYTQRVARYNVASGIGRLEVGSELGRYGEIRAGLLFGAARASLDTGPQELEPPGHARLGAFTTRLVIDRYDSANFPRNGYGAAANITLARKWLGADDEYSKWDLEAAWNWSSGPHTVQLGGRFAGRFGNHSLPVYDLVQWGGLLQQSGYPTGALLGEGLQYGRLVYYYKLVNMPVFEGVYLGASAELGRVQRPLVPGSSTALLKSSALFLGMDTPLGPFYLGYGYAADGAHSAYLYLGRP